MSLKADKGDPIRLIMFLLSPFFSIPFIIHGIYERSRTSIYLFCGVIGFVGYLFVPTASNDKAYYYFLYDYFKNMSIADLFLYLSSERTDYIFYLFIYLFSNAGIPLHFLFLVLAFITLSIWYGLFLRIWDKYNPKHRDTFFLFFILILFSFSPAGLFSGVRFYLAISIALYAYVSFSLDKNNFKKGIFFVIAAAFTHFSCFIFIPFYLFLYFFQDKSKLFYTIFYVSFIFLVIPRSFLLDRVDLFEVSDVYNQKALGYLGDQDYIENSISVGNFNNYLKFLFKSVWVFVAYYYVFVFRKNESLLKKALLLVLAISNVFYSAPTIYNRYILLALGLYLFLLITDYLSGVKNKKIIYITFIVLGLNFLGNVYAMRSAFLKSINHIYSLTLPSLILKEDIQLDDIK